jgi:hypothetical protein
MKKITMTALMVAAIGTSAVFADGMASMAKEAAMSKVKSTAKETIVKEVAKNTSVSEDMVKKVADKVSPEASATDKVKGAVAEKLMAH